MKKVLIAFDGKHFSESAFAFVNQLNQKSPVLVTGIFLPAIDYAELLYSLGGMSGPIYYQDVPFDDTDIIQGNIDRFKELCTEYGIEYRVHPDVEKHVIAEVQEESRYADLLVISSELFYQNLGADTQKDYIETVLHKSQCPVVLIPEQYGTPENIILAYDGSDDSIFAIKQFFYLLPEFTKLKTLLFYSGTHDVPSLENIKELTDCHFSDLYIYRMEADARRYFNTWLEDNGKSFLVAGAYGRSLFSEMFKKSFIADTIQEHKIPIFVAHR